MTILRQPEETFLRPQLGMKMILRIWENKYPFMALVLLCFFSLAIVSCGGSEQNMENGQTISLAAQGQAVFDKNCDRCHSLEEGKVIVGPSLKGIALRAGSRVEELDSGGYIRESIMKPSAYIVDGFNDLMPSNFAQLLRGNEIDALVAFLLTIK